MLGPAVIIVALVVVIPVVVCLSGGAVAGILGYFLRDDVEKEYEGTEYVELGR